MIGNDIIDLEVALQKRKGNNPRFLDKIFTIEEQLKIFGSSNAEIKIWQFWSMKEAAYKAHQRQFNLSRTFNPKSFNCQLDLLEGSGIVNVENSTYHTQTEMNSRYIHSSVSDENAFYRIYNSKVSKEKIIEHVFPFLKVEKDVIKFFKNEKGIPYIAVDKSEKKYPISLSHHGNFTAFLFPLIKS